MDGAPRASVVSTETGVQADAAYRALRAADDAHGPLPLDRRRELLTRLMRAMADRADDVAAAIDADYGSRGRGESLAAEVLATVESARHARANLRRWARPRRVSPGAPFWPSSAAVVPQPLGVVGVMSPWNYPVLLALGPAIGALAAGNRVALKPSETTPRTADLIAEIAEAALGPDVARTVTGGPEAAAAFAAQPWDHLVFTGSGATGRKVMRAAAETLVPLTLELGGKCPAVVLPDADPEEAAAAIVRGKGPNAGQTCIAPDTVLLAGGDADRFVAALRRAHARMYPEGLPTAVVDDRQRARLERLSAGALLEPLGPGRAVSVVRDPPEGSPLLDEEVFGPVLPLVRLGSLDEAVAWIRARPHPLAVFVFGGGRAAEERLMADTRSGALVVGGTFEHAAMEGLPFGGVGASGFGRYHGEAGFLAFSNLRGRVRMSRLGLHRLMDPPWTARAEAILRRLIRR